MVRPILVSACLLGVCCRYDGRSNPNPDVIALLDRDDILLIPVCPEQLGGMPTPRIPSERSGDQVVNRAGEDVTQCFLRGAQEALKLAQLYSCETAILKERSPSCGSGAVYDGTFTGHLIPGEGVTAELLRNNGVRIFGESETDQMTDNSK